MPKLPFVLRAERFCIHRLPCDWPLDYAQLAAAGWCSITRTGTETSIVAPEGIRFGAGDCRCGWSCLQIDAELDFSMVGVLAAVSGILAAANVSIFAVSTYTTDCIFVGSTDVDTAVQALAAAGHLVTRARVAAS